ncbi:polyprenyl synthetase family protein [Amycolatopsis nigrescens]|uniref:polyprenyl synthetase family protein n=1 Tax=Amycolatopsis nigrescens TaxID=381445 RepID=UPI00036EC5AA|nr:polyprenyl synthetase family protein [Amycolatopsis nigrescens]
MVATEGVVTGRTAEQILRDVRGAVDRRLRVVVADRLAEPTRAVAGYHFGWCDVQGRLTRGGSGSGKAIRPALVCLCAQAVGGVAERAVDAAVAVELAHNFTLLHDDIMDGDTVRRHRRTVWSVFGVPAAILAGDALLVLALDVLATSPVPGAAEMVRMLSGALLKIVAGQEADMAFEQRDVVSLDECVAMAGNKTAALLGCACALGALFGGAPSSGVARLHEFGTRLGLAYQLVDDLLGIWGEPSVTGKPVRADLRAGKKSLPVVAALTSGTAAGRRFTELYRRSEPLTKADLDLAAELIEQAGGRHWAQTEADQHLRRALSCLRSASPEPRAAAELTTVAELITRRNH